LRPTSVFASIPTDKNAAASVSRATLAGSWLQLVWYFAAEKRGQKNGNGEESPLKKHTQKKPLRAGIREARNVENKSACLSVM